MSHDDRLSRLGTIAIERAKQPRRYSSSRPNSLRRAAKNEKTTPHYVRHLSAEILRGCHYDECATFTNRFFGPRRKYIVFPNHNRQHWNDNKSSRYRFL